MRKRVLYHLHTIPVPVDGGDRARINGILNYFQERKSSLEVDAFSSENCLEWKLSYGAGLPERWRPEIIDFVRQSADHVFIHKGRFNPGEYLYARAMRGFYRRIRRELVPIDTGVAVARSYASFVRTIAAQGSYDYVWINYLDYARLGLVEMPEHTLRVIDLHDLASASRYSKRDLPEFRGLKCDFEQDLAREMKVLNKFDKIVVNSSEELEVIKDHIAIEKLCLLPHDVEPPEASMPIPEYGSRQFKYDLLYVGSDQVWNVKAVEHFLTRSFPEIVRRIPGVRLAIVGKVGKAIQLGDSLRENVEILGVIPSLGDIYLASRVVICPLLEGAGTKLKLSEAIYYQVPIVTTSVGVSGLRLTDGASCLVRDRPDEFAEAAIGLLQQPGEARAMAAELGGLHEREYSRSMIYRRLDELFGIV